MSYTSRAVFGILTPSREPNLGGKSWIFEVGDKVIYPNHGLGVVEKIEEKTILGTTCGFYSLRMTASDTTVLVPVNNVEDVGLRRAIADSEVKRLFTLLGNGKIDNHQNWKGRFKDNSDKMRTGSIRDVIDVLKSLNFLSKSKNLSFREKRMLDRAKFLVVSEISEVTGEGTDEHRGQGGEGPRPLPRQPGPGAGQGQGGKGGTKTSARPPRRQRPPRRGPARPRPPARPPRRPRPVSTAKTAEERGHRYQGPRGPPRWRR